MADVFTWISSTIGGYWSDRNNWRDNTTGSTPATRPPAAGDTVTLSGGTGFAFQILAGPGQAGKLTLVGNTAIEGPITAATAVFGIAPAGAQSIATAPAVDIEPKSAVTVTAGATIYSPFEIDGSGAELNVTGGLTVGLSSTGIGPSIVLVNDASMLADNAKFYGGSLFVDPTAAAEIGSAGGAAVGELTIDNGATLTTQSYAIIYPQVIDNGLILVGGAATFEDSIGGTGTLDVQASTDNFTATVSNTVNGLASILVGAGSRLSVGDNIESTKKIEIGSGSNLFVGNLSNDGPIIDDGSLDVTGDVTGSSSIAVGTSGTLSVGGTLSGLSGVTMGVNTVFDLSGQDTSVPITLGANNNVLINLSEGSNIDGSVTGFDSSDLIASTQTSAESYITTSAVWSAGTLSLLSGGGVGAPAVVSTLALSGNYTGQQFLTNAVGVNFGETDIVLPKAFITTGIGAGNQTITGSAFRQFTLLTGGGHSGAVTESGNIALEGTYTATSLLLKASVSTTIDALDLQNNTSLSVSGNATVQTNLELDGPTSSMTVGGSLAVGGTEDYFGEVLLVDNASLRANSLTLFGETYEFGSVHSNPDVAVLGGSSLELGSVGGVAADTLQIDQGHTLTGAVESGDIKVKFIVDNGLVTQIASAQGLSQLTLGGDVSGSGKIDAAGDIYITGDLTGIPVVTIEQDAKLSVGGNFTAVGTVTIATGATFEVDGAFDDAIAIEVGANGAFNVQGDTTGITSLTLDNGASSELTGVLSDVGPITLQDNASLQLDNGGVGSGLISMGANTTITIGGTLSGWTGILLGANSSLSDAGEIDAPVSLSGDDTINLYEDVTISKPITGFDNTDLIVSHTSAFDLNGTPITAAVWQQGSGDSGTLTLSDDGVTEFTFTLTGTYAAQGWITSAVNMFGDAALGSSSISLNGPTQNGLTGPVLTGSTGQLYTILSGSGTEASLTITDNVAITGKFTATNLTVDYADSSTDNAVLIETGASLRATTATLNTFIEADGAGATFDVSGTLTMNNDYAANVLLALNDARIRVGSVVTANPNDNLFGSSILAVDKTASIEVGKTGGAALGAVTVDAGATIYAGTNTDIDGALVIDGTFISSNLQETGLSEITGDVTGTGTLVLEDHGSLSTIHSVIGLSAITVTGADLTVYADLTGIGSITAADQTGITVDGDMTGGGNITIGGALTTDQGASIEVEGAASGTGTLTLGVNSAATLHGVTSGFTEIVDGPGALLDFEDAETGSPILMQAGSTLEVGPTDPVSGVISGFNHTTLLEFRQDATDDIVTAATWTKGANGLGTLTLTDDGVEVGTLTLKGDYTNDQFLTNYAAMGTFTDITVASIPCFAAGTMLKTVRGDIAVEDLRTGDRVMLARGGLAPIVWIGHRTVDCTRHPRPAEVWPVRVRAGAIGDNAPRRDLFLSPDHAIFLPDVLVPIKQLINGTTIAQVPTASVTYYHVELPEHDVLLAEELAAESYLDTGNRGTFVNSPAPLVLHPNLAEPDSQARRKANSCVPLLCDAKHVERIWRSLASRAAMIGMPVAAIETTDDPMLRVQCGNDVIRPFHHRGGAYQFVLPNGHDTVRLLSRSALACLQRPWIEDRRQLGVMVKRISVYAGASAADIDMHDKRLLNGWWAAEQDSTSAWRWTNGDALLPIAAMATSGKQAMLEVVVGETVPYPVTEPSSESACMAA